MNTKTDALAVMLATPDADLGLCAFDALSTVGQQAANDERCTVTARDVITDELIATFTPTTH